MIMKYENWLKKVEKTDGCWLWTGAKNASGYGLYTWREGGKSHCMGAHRAGYILTHGDIDRDVQCCHRCDNPGCVNPEHIFLGSAKDNAQDMLAKGRHSKTRKPHTRQRKFTNDQIAAMASDPRELGEVAQAFGVSKSYLRMIRNGTRKAMITRACDVV